jgi:hypothetical protein
MAVSSINDQITEPPLILPGWVLVSRRYSPLPQRASSLLKNVVPSEPEGAEASSPPEYAVEFSLQCHPRADGIMDGMIVFSHVLMPFLLPLLLPVLGIDYDVVKGTGPIIQRTDRRRHAQLGCSNTLRHCCLKRSFHVFAKRRCRDFLQEAEQAWIGFVGVCALAFAVTAYTLQGKLSKHYLMTNELLLADQDGRFHYNWLTAIPDTTRRYERQLLRLLLIAASEGGLK